MQLLSIETLAQVTGAGGVLDSAYKGVVFDIASRAVGTQLAQKMYGARVTDSDTARAQAALKQFLERGDKLPKGVPDLFG